MNESGPAKPGRRPQTGAPLVAPVAAFTAVTIAYAVTNRLTPHPDASALAVLHYAQTHRTTIKLGSFLLFSSSVPLAVASGVIYRRLRALGVTAPGSGIALVGGVLASAALAVSAMFAWAGGRLPADAPPTLARAFADVSFVAGGPWFAVAFGLLIAGLAVSGLLLRLIPRPLAWVGLVLAVCGVLSELVLLADGFGYLLPVVRFGGALWLLVAASVLPRNRHQRQAKDAR